MRKVFVAGAVLAGLLAGNMWAGDKDTNWSVVSTSFQHNSIQTQLNARVSSIKCSNGNTGDVYYFYNMPHVPYYVKGSMFKSFEEAANFICGNK